MKMRYVALALVLVGCEGKKSDKASLPPAATVEQKPAAAVEAAAQNATEAAAPASPEPVAAPVATPAPSVAPPAEPGTTLAGDTAPAYQYRLTGSVAAQRRSQLSFRVAGFIDQIVAKPGNIMKKDQILASLDGRDFAVRLDLAKARRDQAKVALDNAAKEFQREKQLQKDNASTPTAFDRVQSAYEQAKLALKLAELDVVTAQNALDDTKLRAPYDAIVAKQLKDVSENVQVGNGIFEIYDIGIPEVTLEAPERLMGQIKTGDELTVQVPSANFSGKGRVTRLVNVINDKTRTFQIIVQLNEKDERIVAGSYAEAVMD